MDFKKIDSILRGDDTAAQILLMKELGDSGEADALPRIFFILGKHGYAPKFQKPSDTYKLWGAEVAALAKLTRALGLDEIPIDAFVDLAIHPFSVIKKFDAMGMKMLPAFKAIVSYPGLDQRIYSVLGKWMAARTGPEAADALAEALEANLDDQHNAYLISRSLGGMGDPRVVPYLLRQIAGARDPAVVRWDLELLETVLRKSAGRCSEDVLQKLALLRAFEDEYEEINYGSFDSHERTGKALEVDTSEVRKLAGQELARRTPGQLAEERASDLSTSAKVPVDGQEKKVDAPRPASEKCSICSTIPVPFEKESEEPPAPYLRDIPGWANALVPMESPSKKEEILCCPECGIEYLYKTWGGKQKTKDSRTPYHQTLLSQGQKSGKESAAAKAPKCPKCGSFRVLDLGLAGDAVQAFRTLRCGACGNEDILDEWQLSDWSWPQ